MAIRSAICLPLFHNFNDPEKKALKNIAGKAENAGNQHFLFPQSSPTYQGQTYDAILTTSKLLSANSLNSDKSNKLSFGKELINCLLHNPDF